MSTRDIMALEKIYSNMGKKQIKQIENFNKNDTILIIMDLNNGFVCKGNLQSDNVKKIVDEARIIAKRFEKREIKSIAFTDAHNENSVEFKTFPRHCINNTYESEIIDEFLDIKDMSIIKKNSTNGFNTKKFQNWLKNNKEIKNYVIIGDCIDICVLQFALSLKAYFNEMDAESSIVVPIEGVATYDDGELHNSKLLGNISLQIMENAGIEIVSNIE